MPERALRFSERLVLLCPSVSRSPEGDKAPRTASAAGRSFPHRKKAPSESVLGWEARFGVSSSSPGWPSAGGEGGSRLGATPQGQPGLPWLLHGTTVLLAWKRCMCYFFKKNSPASLKTPVGLLGVKQAVELILQTVSELLGFSCLL